MSCHADFLLLCGWLRIISQKPKQKAIMNAGKRRKVAKRRKAFFNLFLIMRALPNSYWSPFFPCAKLFSVLLFCLVLFTSLAKGQAKITPQVLHLKRCSMFPFSITSITSKVFVFSQFSQYVSKSSPNGHLYSIFDPLCSGGDNTLSIVLFSRSCLFSIGSRLSNFRPNRCRFRIKIPSSDRASAISAKILVIHLFLTLHLWWVRVFYGVFHRIGVC